MASARLCFILGIDRRSGTNYLFRLMRKHPCCLGPGPIWEDHVMEHAGLLGRYVDSLVGEWNPRWGVDQTLGGRGVLLRHLGDALAGFLQRQLTATPGGQAALAQDPDAGAGPPVLLTKTPSVVGVEAFPDLFPEAHLILLVRDGRALVESGVRSFNWDYEEAMCRWRDRARTIIAFMAAQGGASERVMLLKYEDLVVDAQGRLRQLNQFLGLDPEACDFEQVEAMGIIGSSDLKQQTESVYWKESKKAPGFDPLARFAGWGPELHERFNRIAGREMLELAYEIGANRL